MLPLVTLLACSAPDTRTESEVAAQATRQVRPGAAVRTSIGICFLPVQAGTYRLGFTVGQTTNCSTVTISQQYWIARTEVTQAQWLAVMHTTPWAFCSGQAPDAPAAYMTWYEAREFCERLEQQQRALGSIPVGYRIALPSEAEWEIACRAGSESAFCFGSSFDVLSGYAVWRGNSSRYPTVVADKLPNALGLYDMHGNVWEWCEDAFQDHAPGGTDPLVKTGAARVRRGGSADSEATLCQASHRDCSSPDATYCYLGFRPALVAR
jgi:formylglycine-generating enzyme required for sulfatase activity